MSRHNKARRRARKARPKRLVIPESTGLWGSGPELTAQERARVLSRFSCLRGRSVTIGFVFPFGWVRAGTPEELEEAVREKLAADSVARRQN